MRLAFLLCVGCGRVAFDARDDATTTDDFWAAWRAGTPAIANLAPISELASPEKEGNPWLTADGRSLYFDRGTGDTTIHVAYRLTTTAFSEPEQIASLSSPLEDTGLVMTADERLGVFSSSRAGSQGFDLWEVRRDLGVFNTPTQTAFVAIDNADNQVDAFFSTDGKRVYFSESTPTGQALRVASRAATTDAFSPPTIIPGMGAFPVEADVDLSPDERVLAFAAAFPQQIYVATRDSTAAPFRPPVKLTALASSGNDGDPAFSADGCELFWVSDRGGNRDIWRAYVSPL